MELKVEWLSSNSAAPAPTASVPSLFGQLVSLASRCFQSGDDRELHLAHREAFERWLCLKLEQQKADLEEYAEWLGTDVQTVLGRSLESDAHRLEPADVCELEHRLFIADLETLLKVGEGGSE